MARIAPKARAVAETVRGMIAAGELAPGDIAPSAPALAAQTGTCYSYCLAALRQLTAEGTLEAGRPPRGRPRVPRAGT